MASMQLALLKSLKHTGGYVCYIWIFSLIETNVHREYWQETVKHFYYIVKSMWAPCVLEVFHGLVKKNNSLGMALYCFNMKILVN